MSDRVPVEAVERASSVDDVATQVEEREREAALAAHRDRAAAEPRLTPGICSNCDEVLEPDQYFCDASCRDDHDRRQAARRRNGR